MLNKHYFFFFYNLILKVWHSTYQHSELYLQLDQSKWRSKQIPVAIFGNVCSFCVKFCPCVVMRHLAGGSRVTERTYRMSVCVQGVPMCSCWGEKKGFANVLLLVQLFCQGLFLYQQCSSILNLVSAFSHIWCCVCAHRFPHAWVSRHGQHALCNILSLHVKGTLCCGCMRPTEDGGRSVWRGRQETWRRS